MNKVKILLSEEPKTEYECPFCTTDGCVLTVYDSSLGTSCGSLGIGECYGTVRDGISGYVTKYDFSKCPFCVALNKLKNKNDEVAD